jgi:hypothetical protein
MPFSIIYFILYERLMLTDAKDNVSLFVGVPPPLLRSADFDAESIDDTLKIS